MRRLIRLVTTFLGATTAFLVLTLFSLSALSAHSSASQAQGASCVIHCGTQVQPAAPSSQTERKDKKDKKTAPILLYWQQTPVNLLALYLIPIAYLFVFVKRDILLETSLLRL